ncbi:hypothetical protein [Bacillus gobiensis]
MEKELLSIFEDWENKLDKDERYFSNSYEKLIYGLSSETAFNHIPDVLKVLLMLKRQLFGK